LDPIKERIPIAISSIDISVSGENADGEYDFKEVKDLTEPIEFSMGVRGGKNMKCAFLNADGDLELLDTSNCSGT